MLIVPLEIDYYPNHIRRNYGINNSILHFASLIYKETSDNPVTYKIIKNRKGGCGVVSKEALYDLIKEDPPTEVHLQGETFIIIDPSSPSFIWYIEGTPATLMRKSDSKKFYYVNRKLYNSEADYIFHKSILDHQK